MKEKVLYVSLPEGAEYLRVEVAEDGKIGIVYAEKARASKTETTKAAPAVSKAERKAKRKPIPKPEPLIGGTPVYQKDNGTGYWYCKIKDGRDEFMYLYFGDLTENDVLYDVNGKEREFIGDRQLEFKENCLKAVRNKPNEGFRWIPVYEPSEANGHEHFWDGNIQYVPGENVLRGVYSYQWERIFKNYSPENGSQEASIATCFLLALRWLKDGLATIGELAEDSGNIGHYSNSENAKDDFEKTGEHEFGGLYGFVGNIPKQVKDPESSSGFSYLGGCYENSGNECPLAYIYHVANLYGFPQISTGLIELTK